MKTRITLTIKFKNHQISMLNSHRAVRVCSSTTKAEGQLRKTICRASFIEWKRRTVWTIGSTKIRWLEPGAATLTYWLCSLRSTRIYSNWPWRWTPINKTTLINNNLKFKFKSICPWSRLMVWWAHQLLQAANLLNWTTKTRMHEMHPANLLFKSNQVRPNWRVSQL